VLIGDNNTGKTTILEAIDLVLGPDRLNRTPPIDEHDFYQGKYTADTPVLEAVEGNGTTPGVEGAESETIDDVNAQADDDIPAEAPQIEIEVTIGDLTEEQKGRFGDYMEFWDTATNTLYDAPNPDGVDKATITEALRVTFIGCYDPEEDDFEGKTYFTRSLSESENPIRFSKKDKQICGFLYLRSLRTGSRALSLERGSLLDIILRLKEVRPQMWEDTIDKLASYSVASDPELGISGVLESINIALKKYVPKEWGIEPHLKVSNLTREHLRKVPCSARPWYRPTCRSRLPAGTPWSCPAGRFGTCRTARCPPGRDIGEPVSVLVREAPRSPAPARRGGMGTMGVHRSRLALCALSDLGD
jgi:putative ATP-dependent endonuclease of OLD family